MIFVTVGAQMPFDRLIKVVDQWAGENSDIEIIAQIGNTEYKPVYIKNWSCLLDVKKFTEYVKKCDLIVSHAGMGTIITALQYKKPIIVMPRRGDLKETRNDHQVDTARQLSDKVNVAFNEEDLISSLKNADKLGLTSSCENYAEKGLISEIFDYINS